MMTDVDDCTDLLKRLERAVVVPAAVVPDRPAPGLGMLVRYLSGEPLVRKHHTQAEGWSWLCPVETCQKWRVGYESPAACRVGWYAHCAEPGHDPLFEPKWPTDLPCTVTQMVTKPGNGDRQLQVLLDLIGSGRAVDREGRPLTFTSCLPCTRPGESQHLVVSGTTCVWQVKCPACGAEPSAACDVLDRSAPYEQGGHYRLPGAHTPRFIAAGVDEMRRWAAGDMTIPAEWASEPAPSRRRSGTAGAPAMRATVRIGGDFADTDLLRSWLIEYRNLGRLWWEAGAAHVAFETVDMATLSRNLLTSFYSVPGDAVTVLRGVDRPATEATVVAADARQTLRRFEHLAAGELAWAVGAFFVTNASVFETGRADPRVLAAQQHTHGYVGDGLRMLCEGDVVTVMSFQSGVERRITWSRVAAAAGTVAGDLLAEVGEVGLDVAAFPVRSRERLAADAWSRDVAAKVWAAARPASLAPFDPRTAAEQKS